jgi:type VI secretion system protein ImpF
MSRPNPPQSLLPSILDRLIDPESAGTAWRRGYGPEQMVDVVQRDLEELLNTRQSHQGMPAEFQELGNSVLGYGFPDLTSLNAITPEQRDHVGRLLESVIGRFEPRLKDIRATLVDPGDGKERTVRFRIEARLCLDPAPAVAFDTVLELTTGHYSVKPSHS